MAESLGIEFCCLLRLNNFLLTYLNLSSFSVIRNLLLPYQRLQRFTPQEK